MERLTDDGNWEQQEDLWYNIMGDAPVLDGGDTCGLEFIDGCIKLVSIRGSYEYDDWSCVDKWSGWLIDI